MSLKAVELLNFGGVDSRSNPIAMPKDRALRMINWKPKEDGHLELRHGYTTESMSVVTPIPIHSLLPFRTWDSSQRFLITGQGTNLTLHDLSNQTDTPAQIRGAAIESPDKWGFYNANNRIHIGNGLDQKFFDGNSFRDNGLRAPLASEVTNVIITDGVREFSTAENASVAFTVTNTGSFSTTSGTGYAFFIPFFDTSNNEVGPATSQAGARVTVTGSGKKITISGLPAPSTSSWIKLIARTSDGGSKAYFCTNTSTAITSASRASTLLTVTSAAHGLSSGDVVIQTGIPTGPGSLTLWDGIFVVTVLNVNTYTVNLATPVGSYLPDLPATPTVKRIVSVANATTTVSVTDTAQDTTYQVNQTLGLAASAIGGAQPGYQFYGSIYNPTTGHVGNRIALGSRIAPTGRENIRITGLPDYSTVDSEWEFLIGRTGDGAEVPYVIIDSNGNFVAVTTGNAPNPSKLATAGANLNSGTDWNTPANVGSAVSYSTVTITTPTESKDLFAKTFGFAVSAGQAVVGIQVDIEEFVTVLSGFGVNIIAATLLKNGAAVGNTKSLTVNNASNANLTFGGTADLWGTSFSAADVNNANFGVQFHASGGSFSGPLTTTFNIRNVRITAYTVGSSASITINEPEISGTYELPTRNGVIPPQCTMFARVGDKAYAADPNSPTIRLSGSEADSRQNAFLGRPEQSWAPNDIETFPTAEAVTGIDEIDYQLFVGTLNDSALLVDQNGQPSWIGPWNIGLAGPRATVKAFPYGYFWVTGDKQLATFANSLPVIISGEYEKAELSQIGDTFLSSTELVYFRDPSKGIDEIRINARQSDGTPYTIVHDFKINGQGYSAQYQGPLASSYTVAQARDVNGRYIIAAGATSGQLYLLYQGSNDAGNEYDADAIFLIPVGPSRPDLTHIDWYGDNFINVFIGKTLSASLADDAGDFQFEQLNAFTGSPQAVPGYENSALWRVDMTAPEIQGHLYLRFQLSSHSSDGNLELNSPPHVPVEMYGRIYKILPLMGASRDV